MIGLIIIILFIISLYLLYRNTNKDLVRDPSGTTEIISGTKASGYGLASKMGYPTVNIILNEVVGCGFYTGTILGKELHKVIIIVDHTKKFAECHFLQYDKQFDKIKQFKFDNIKKVEPINGQGLIGTYMRGC